MDIGLKKKAWVEYEAGFCFVPHSVTLKSGQADRRVEWLGRVAGRVRNRLGR